MPIEEDINAFIVWATKLGFPKEYLPNDEAIKSIFKSRQCDLFYNLMKRVRPRQEVSEVREIILIKKLEKFKDQVLPVCSRTFLPKELQTYLKIKELKSKQSKLEERIEEYRKEYDSLASTIKIKNTQHIKLKNKYEIQQARVNIFEVKSIALSKDIEREEQNKKHLMKVMPVKPTGKNACEKSATDAVNKALQELEEFYTIFMSDCNPSGLQEAKENLWNKLRNIFANVPNYMSFNAIMRLKEEQLQNIMHLNKTNSDDSVYNSRTQINLTGSGQSHSYSPFQLKLMKTTAELLGIVAKYLAAQHEHAILEERFSDAYPQFVDALQKKVNLYNADIDDSAEDIISEYIVQYNFRNHHKRQNEFFTEQIEMYKIHMEAIGRELEDHEVQLGSIKQVYNEIESSVNRIQYEILQLNQTKQKIVYSKNILQHMLNDLQTINATTAAATSSAVLHNAANTNKSNLMPTKLSGNNSILCGESFDLSCDVFCSTKLDLNSTMTSLNVTTASRRSLGSPGNIYRHSLPQHLVELNTFIDTPLESFNCRMTNDCAFYLAPNPLIITARQLSSTIQLSPGILLTPFGALREVHNRIYCAEMLKELSNDLKIDVDLVMVETHSFKAKMKEQREQLAELLDKIETVGINTKHTVKKLARLYDFILENPLRNYIPATKCYNNQTFADYESEYTIYYRMATVGASIK